jgi:hypothetical protein
LIYCITFSGSNIDKLNIKERGAPGVSLFGGLVLVRRRLHADRPTSSTTKPNQLSLSRQLRIYISTKTEKRNKDQNNTNNQQTLSLSRGS